MARLRMANSRRISGEGPPVRSGFSAWNAKARSARPSGRKSSTDPLFQPLGDVQRHSPPIPAVVSPVREQPPSRFPSVLSRPSQLVTQFRVTPWWLTLRIPTFEEGQGLNIVECEAANQTAAHPARVEVAVLAPDGGRHMLEVPARPFHAAVVQAM